MVKERSDNQRSYDNDGYKKRAACVCVKNENENEVLLISSSRNKNCWIIPGGSIERNENPEEAAEREVYEEAGVKGRLGRLLGIFEVLENKERKHRTNVYLLIVDKELDEWDENKNLGRVRKWFNLEEAKSELEKHKPVQGTYLNLLKGFDEKIYRKNLNPVNSSELIAENFNERTSSTISNIDFDHVTATSQVFNVSNLQCGVRLTHFGSSPLSSSNNSEMPLKIQSSNSLSQISSADVVKYTNGSSNVDNKLSST